MKKVSIIVTVYNTAQYIRRCLDSIVHQSYIDEIEIILINDGSPDNADEIIKKYQQEHSNIDIKYYKKQNEGISKTRNFGIDKCNTDYLVFVDSDDYINEDFMEKLHKYIEQDIDCIKFKLQKVDKDKNVLEKIDGPVFDKVTGEDAFNKLFGNDILIDSPCLYIIKKKVFIDNNLKFERTYHEDFGLIPFVVVNSKSAVSTPYYLYSYVQEDNESITRDTNYEKVLMKMEDCIVHYDNAMERIEKCNYEKITKENLKIFYTNSIILKLENLNEVDKKRYIRKLRERKIHKNIKVRNIKQLIKRIILFFNINLYLKMR